MHGVFGGRKTKYASIAAIALFMTVVFAMLWAPSPAQASEYQLTTAASSQSTKEVIEPGNYYIQSSLSGPEMLSAYGSANGANAQIWSADSSKAQRWRISEASNGTYTISNVGSGKYLGIDTAKAKSGTNVSQWKNDKSAALRWKIKKSGSGYVITPATNAACALDVSGASSADGTNVQVYKKNGTKAQVWWLIPVKPALESERILANGTYEIQFAKAPSYVIDLANAAYAKGTNIRLYQRNSTLAQRWYFQWQSDGFYSIRSMSSGNAFALESSSPCVGTNIYSWPSSGKDNQRWAVSKNEDGSYTLRNKATGLALEAIGAKAANGTNVRLFVAHGGASEKFAIVRSESIVPEGVYSMYTRLAPTSMVVDIPNGSAKSGAQAQIYSGNGTIAQNFYLRCEGGNVFTIQSVRSGLYLTDKSGKVVQKKQSNSKAQRWVASLNGSAVTFKNVATGKKLAVAGGSAASGTKLVTAKAASTNAQRFRLVDKLLVPNGYYTVRSAYADKLLNVAGGSYSNGANVQVAKADDSDAQIWQAVRVKGKYYKLINYGSERALGVKGSSGKSGADVRQYTYTGADSQLWKPVLRKSGSFVFVNKASGMLLEASGTKNKANVRQATSDGEADQGWTLKSAGIGFTSGDAELDRLVANALKAAGSGGDTLRKAFNYVSSFRYAAGSKNPTGEWSIPFAKEMFWNGAGNCYRFAAAFCWMAKALGYNASVVSGAVPSASSGWAPHGWVEVYWYGTTYVCDPDLNHELPGYNWYWTTYGSAPTTYQKW